VNPHPDRVLITVVGGLAYDKDEETLTMEHVRIFFLKKNTTQMKI